MSNTLTPLEPPFPRDVADILASYPQQDGYILSLFRTFANSVRFLRKCVPNLLDNESPLDPHTRELVILRTTANRNCEYEWGVHVSIFARAAGLSEEQVAATRIDDPSCWSANDQTLISVVDQLCLTGVVDAIVRKEFQDNWSNEEQLEILALVGAYSTVSFVANLAELPGEPFAAKFPASSIDT